MEKASFNIFLATIVVGLLAFAVPSFLPLAAVKTAVIGIGILVSFILYIVSRLKTKSFDFPWSPLVAVGALLGLSVVISSALAVSPYSSFMGKSFGSGAGIFLIVILVAGFLATLLVRTRDRVLVTYAVIVGSFALVAVFQIIRLIPGTSFLSFGFFNTVTTTVVGSWYDFGIFAGLTAILSLLTLEIFPIAKKLRIIVIALFAVSIAFVILIGLPAVWMALAVVALGISIKRYLDLRRDTARTTFMSRVPLFSVIVFVAAVLFSWQGNVVTSAVVQQLNASYAEVALPWQYTLDVAAPTIKAVPLFGAGPDRFINAYLQFKPQIVNSTQFWSFDFQNSTSFFLTSLVTQGLVGFILWILFFVFFCIAGLRALAAKPADDFSRYTLFTSFFASAFLLLMFVLYVPSHAILLLTFVMVGLFVSELVQQGYVTMKMVSWAEPTKARLPIMIGVGLVIAVAAAGIILFAKETIGQVYVQSALQTINTANTTDTAAVLAVAERAKSTLQTSLMFNNIDTTYQALAQVDIYAINALVASASSTSDSSLAKNISSLITESVDFTRTAQKLDPANSYNYIAEASISEVAAGLRIPNGYENARTSYAKALQVNPLNPAIYLSLAKLNYFAGSTTLAFSNLNTALQIKPDYAEALFEVGIISYDQKDYQTAATAFQQALKVNGNYANAAYYLSLTLIRLGDTKDALMALTALDKVYPNNPQITSVLNALNAGRSPFSDAQATSLVSPKATTPVDISTSTTPRPKVAAPTSKR